MAMSEDAVIALVICIAWAVVGFVLGVDWVKGDGND
jgi:hypothetical protein